VIGSDSIDYEREIRRAIEGGQLTISDEWEGFPGRAFGGFAAAAVLAAAALETEQPRPLSIFARFHRPIPIRKAVNLAVQTQRRGQLVDVLEATLHDGDCTLAHFTLAFGRDGESPLRSQAIRPITPLRELTPAWRLVEGIGLDPPLLMRRVGYRIGAPDAENPDTEGVDWHLHGQWPDTRSDDLAIRAGITLMPIDVCVAPAAINANGLDVKQPSPVMMPSLDLAAWFYAPESTSTDVDSRFRNGWLSSRTSVPVTNAAYAVGRTQVWSGDRFVAEGMSQVVLIPA
jgi:acyl-CoA thioesterase